MRSAAKQEGGNKGRRRWKGSCGGGEWKAEGGRQKAEGRRRVEGRCGEC